MKLERYVGDIVQISPVYNEMKVHWITQEQHIENSRSRPSAWFEYQGWMYLMVCDYEFHFLEQYEDWVFDDGVEFSEWYPGAREIDKMLGMNPTFFKVNAEEIYKSDLDYYCDYELEFIKKWHKGIIRDNKIDDILN